MNWANTVNMALMFDNKTIGRLRFIKWAYQRGKIYEGEPMFDGHPEVIALGEMLDAFHDECREAEQKYEQEYQQALHPYSEEMETPPWYGYQGDSGDENYDIPF